MKNASIVRLVPFDLGHSFIEFDYQRRQSAEDFLNQLREKLLGSELQIIDNTNIDNTNSEHVICSIELTPDIKCHVLDYGAGVFEIHNFTSREQCEADNFFRRDTVCSLYYDKKHGQHSILDKEGDIYRQIIECSKIIWSCIKVKSRPISANTTYKNGGFSYVFSIYALGDIEDSELDLLMQPSLLYNIEKPERWGKIKKDVEQCLNSNDQDRPKRYSECFECDYSDSLKIASSWSAVAMIGENSEQDIRRIISYEISLQAAWFLYDCIADNLYKTHFGNVELQRIKSLTTNISLEIDNIVSANMGTNQKRTMESIYSSSGFKTIKNKLTTLLENRISIEEARLTEEQKRYGIITEILLVLFTLVSIYDPIRNLIFGNLEIGDYIVFGFMLVLLVLSAYFIIRKERK